MSIESGTPIGPYRIERPLGEGGMGAVYKAFDERLERWVALKQIRPESAAKPKSQARFRREAKAAARLSHPAIVPVFDWLETPEGQWIVMELVDGPSLRDLLKSRTPTEAELMRWSRHIAEGLATAHEAGILHRDLKAENVLISPSGRARIVDFGLAKPLADSSLADSQGEPSVSVSGEIIGTVRVMSPEQARGLELGPKSDLFSLGVLLYEMASGTSPFEGRSAVDTLTRICTQNPRPLDELVSGLPEIYVHWTHRLLEKVPDLRPGSATEVAEAFAAAVSGSSSSQDPEPDSRITALPSTDRSSTATDATDVGTWAGVASDGDAPRAAQSANEDDSGSATRSSALEPIGPWRRPSVGTGLRAFAALLILGVGIWLISDRWTARTSSANSTNSATVDRPLEPSRKEVEPYALYRQGIEKLNRFDRLENVDQAIDIFRQLMAEEPDSAPAHAGLARAYWRKYFNGSQDEQWLRQAIAVAERSVALEPHLSDGRISLAFALIASGRYDEALEHLNTVLAVDPEHPDGLRGLADIQLNRGELEQALETYRRASGSRPQDPETQDQIGVVLYRLARYEEALTAFSGAIELRPDNAISHRNQAAAYHMLGNVSDAAKALQTALAIQPSSTVYANLGTLYFFQGLYTQAAEAFEKALGLGGLANASWLWANLGDARRFGPASDLDSAHEAWQQALRLGREALEDHPQDLDLLSREALYLAKLGREETASRLKELDTADWQDAGACYRTAVAWELIGERRRALDLLDQARRMGFSLEEVERDPFLLDLRSDPAYHRRLLAPEDTH